MFDMRQADRYMLRGAFINKYMQRVSGDDAASRAERRVPMAHHQTSRLKQPQSLISDQAKNESQLVKQLSGIDYNKMLRSATCTGSKEQ